MTIAQQLNVKEFPFEINDSNGNEIYCEDSDGGWYKSEYDSNGNKIYYEDSNGIIIKDSRPKEYTMDEVAKALGVDVNQLKIKK